MLNTQDFKDFQKTLAILFFAMLAGQIIFALVSLWLVSSGAFEATPALRNPFLMIVPLLVFGGFIAGNYQGRRLLLKAQEAETPEEKLNIYRSSMLMRFALPEGPSLMAIIAFLLTGERLFLGFTGMILFYFVTLYPSATRISNDLEFPDEDR